MVDRDALELDEAAAMAVGAPQWPILLIAVALKCAHDYLFLCTGRGWKIFGEDHLLVRVITDPVVWLSAFLMWKTVHRIHSEGRAADLWLTSLSSRRMFAVTYFSIAMRMLAISAASFVFVSAIHLYPDTVSWVQAMGWARAWELNLAGMVWHIIEVQMWVIVTVSLAPALFTGILLAVVPRWSVWIAAIATALLMWGLDSAITPHLGPFHPQSPVVLPYWQRSVVVLALALPFLAAAALVAAPRFKLLFRS